MSASQRASRWERFRDSHPVLVAVVGFALCVAFPFAYNLALEVFH